jgi:hypothetical protein
MRVTVAVFLSGLIVLLTLAATGCGGGSSTPAIAVSVTSSSPNGVDQGQTLSLTASVTNDSKSAGVQWSVSGGGTLSAQTTTSATFTAPASVTSAFTATVTATSITDPTKSASVQIKVSPPPTITTTSVATATAGVSYSATLSVSGGTTPFKWTITSGTLPAGLSLSPNTGAITGTPTGASSGSVTFEVTDAAGVSYSRAITITVNAAAPLSITTTTLPGGTIGTAYSQTLQVTGGVPSYTWSITAGSLPAGLTLSSAGVISGTPTGTVTSTSHFTVSVTDSQTPTAVTRSASLSITVTEPPLGVTTTSLAGGTKNTAYSQTLQAIGGTPPYTWSIISGALPAGLTLNTATGVISGTPTATGTSNFTVQVQDSATPKATATAALSIAIDAQLAITTTSLPGGSISTAYSATVVASGGVQPYTWTITSGTLPAGLTLNSGTGVISGTPTATGTSDFTITVADSESPAVKVSASLSIAIATQSCANNSTLSGHYAILLNGWNGSAISAAVGSFVADGGGNISTGILDTNDQTTGPKSGTFTGTYCVASNNLATINVTYGGLTGTNTFAAALNSGGSNGSIIYYDDSGTKASGLLRQQGDTVFTTGEIDGNYAFEVVGLDSTGGRSAMAGAFTATGSASLTGEVDATTYSSLPVNTTLTASDLTVASNGRGTVTMNFTSLSTQSYVFYVVSSSELLIMEDDIAGSSLLAGRVLEQSGTFTDSSLSGVGVIELESLSGGVTSEATAGLLTTNGTGTFSLTADQNLGGTTSTLSYSGNYSTSSNGRVTLSVAGESTPVFYLIGENQAFVVGTNNFTVDSGVLVPQSGSTFSVSSLSGTYQGGSLQPVDTNVSEEVDAIQATAGSFSGTAETNSGSGPATNALSGTYAVSSNGRVVVTQAGSQTAIMFVISLTQAVLLPSSDTNPKLSQFQH